MRLIGRMGRFSGHVLVIVIPGHFVEEFVNRKLFILLLSNGFRIMHGKYLSGGKMNERF